MARCHPNHDRAAERRLGYKRRGRLLDGHASKNAPRSNVLDWTLINSRPWCTSASERKATTGDTSLVLETATSSCTT